MNSYGSPRSILTFKEAEPGSLRLLPGAPCEQTLLRLTTAARPAAAGTHAAPKLQPWPAPKREPRRPLSPP